MGLMTINVAVGAGKDTGRPKLVVGIVVDQLRTDYLDYLEHLFGEKGFRRLINNGVYVRNLDFQADLRDPVSATALLYTGALPNASGVPGDEVYSSSERKVMPVLHDAGSMGNFTSETLSPVNLRLSTIADEVAVDGMGLTSVYALSANPQQAVVMAGHAGSAALWINDRDGQWSSTTYYRDFPQIVSQRNRQRPLRERLDTLRWTPALKAALYPGLPMQKREYPFRHSFTGADRDLYVKFKNSAPANTEVTDVAIDLIKNLSIGKRPDAIDMISVGYSAAPFRYVKDGDARMELADTYIRLDSQIGRLLDAIDTQTGLDNCVIFLTSTGYYEELAKDDPKFRIPTGEVSIKRVESLLNAYLSAKYGNGDYVDGIYADNIYLNHKAIEGKSTDEHVIVNDARDFIVKMSGIAGAHTLGDLLSDPSETGRRMRNALDPKTAGDIILTYSPGWTVVDDTHYPACETPQRSATVSAPFILMAPGRKAEVITETIDARRIAPTISSSIHIRAPNGAEKTSF